MFASSDRDDASFKEYFAEMPWLAIPLGDKRKEELSDMLDVEGKLYTIRRMSVAQCLLPASDCTVTCN